VNLGSVDLAPASGGQQRVDLLAARFGFVHGQEEAG
jgi:hypothetical protein